MTRLADGGVTTTRIPLERDLLECSSSESGLEMKKIFLLAPGPFLLPCIADCPAEAFDWCECAVEATDEDGTGGGDLVLGGETSEEAGVRLGCLVTGGESDTAAFRGGLGESAALRLAGVGGGAMAPGPGRASTDVGTHTEGVGLSSEVGDGSKPLTKLAGRNDAARSAVLCVRLCKLTSLRFRDSATASIAVSDGVRGTSAPSREGGDELGDAGRDLRVRGRADMAKFEGNRRCKAGVGAGGSVLPEGAANGDEVDAGAGDEFARDRAGETSELVRRDRNFDEFSSSVVEKVGEVGAEACRDALLRPSGALEPREPSGGLTGAAAAGTSLKLRAFPKGGISGIRCKSAIMRCSELPLMTCSGLPSRENPRRARAGRATRLDPLPSPPQVESGEVGAVAAAAAGTEVVRGRACTLDCGDTDDEPVVAALRASVGLPALTCPSPGASPSSSPLLTLDSLSEVSSHSGSLHSSGTAACASPFCFGAASSRSGSRRPESNHNLHERFSSRRPFCRLSLHRVKTACGRDHVSMLCRLCAFPVRLTGPELCETVRVDLADGGKRVWREREHVRRQSGVHLVPMHGARGLCAPRCARA